MNTKTDFSLREAVITKMRLHGWDPTFTEEEWDEARDIALDDMFGNILCAMHWVNPLDFAEVMARAIYMNRRCDNCQHHEEKEENLTTINGCNVTGTNVDDLNYARQCEDYIRR